VIILDLNQKKIVIKAVKCGVNKFEIISGYKNLSSEELKYLIKFYDVTSLAKEACENQDANKLVELYSSDLEGQVERIIPFVIAIKAY
jgi:protein tyrosine/serine phosphatase